MSIVISITNKYGGAVNDPNAYIPQEVSEYLREALPDTSLAFLGQIDPYGTTTLNKKLCLDLQKDIKSTLVQVDSKTILCPPSEVDLEFSPPDDPELFGWDGLKKLLVEIDAVLTKALSTGSTVKCFGD